MAFINKKNENVYATDETPLNTQLEYEMEYEYIV